MFILFKQLIIEITYNIIILKIKKKWITKRMFQLKQGKIIINNTNNVLKKFMNTVLIVHVNFFKVDYNFI